MPRFYSACRRKTRRQDFTEKQTGYWKQSLDKVCGLHSLNSDKIKGKEKKLTMRYAMPKKKKGAAALVGGAAGMVQGAVSFVGGCVGTATSLFTGRALY